MKQPNYIREFSLETKREMAEKRHEMAVKISEARKLQQQRKIEEMSANQIENRIEKQPESTQTVEKIDSLRQKIFEIGDKGYKKITKFIAYLTNLGKIKSDQEEADYMDWLNEPQIQTEITPIKSSAINSLPENFQEPAELLKEFYQNEWSKQEYSKETIDKYFTEEYLSKLSIDDYALLMRRFPSEMVTHVTRQGIRDHSFLTEHQLGAGEYSDNFMKLLKEKRLKSILAMTLSKHDKEKSIKEFLHLDIPGVYEDKKQALNNLDAMLNVESSDQVGSITDRSAVHFACNVAADEFYGSESNNEIFIAYPSAFIASKYHFSGPKFSDYKSKEKGTSPRNDLFVWDNEINGMALDAGLVFLPAKARVDAKTGSQYKLNEKNQPIPDQKSKEMIEKIIFSDQFKTLLKETFEKHLYYPDSNFQKQLQKQLNINDKKIIDVLNYYVYYDNFNFRNIAENNPAKNFPETIDNILKRSGMYYQKNEKTIDSKNYWENFFESNPQLKPSKIVYYDEDSPTEALNNWLYKNKITKQHDKDDYYGFEKNVVNVRRFEKSYEIAEANRFRPIAEKVINDHFDQKSSKNKIQ